MVMKLTIPQPVSAGLFLSYKCTSRCRHCLYACSPGWKADWLSAQDAELVLAQLARSLRGAGSAYGAVGVNEGLHFTGGEPFLNFDLLLQVTEIARRLGLRATFVETNCAWCTSDGLTKDRLIRL
jgi:MoaA/NifB/PqqE/SkfB family radical SAM enzyme